MDKIISFVKDLRGFKNLEDLFQKRKGLLVNP